MKEMKDDEIKLEIDSSIKNSLLKMSPWIKFFSVLWYLGMLGVVFYTFSEVGMNKDRGLAYLLGMIIAGVLIALLWYFPATYLYRYSSNIEEGLNSSNQNALNDGLANLASFWKFIGILTLIYIGVLCFFIISRL